MNFKFFKLNINLAAYLKTFEHRFDVPIPATEIFKLSEAVERLDKVQKLLFEVGRWSKDAKHKDAGLVTNRVIRVAELLSMAQFFVGYIHQPEMRDEEIVAMYRKYQEHENLKAPGIIRPDHVLQ